jgi:hypothetical protein
MNIELSGDNAFYSQRDKVSILRSQLYSTQRATLLWNLCLSKNLKLCLWTQVKRLASVPLLP